MSQVATLSRFGRRIGIGAVAWKDREEGQQGLTADGKLLFALLALTLLGPYLPILKLTSVVGIDVAEGLQGARLDNLAIPAVALYLAARSVFARRLSLPIHLILYFAFLAWLGLMTLIWWANMPAEYADQSARGVGLLRSLDAYTRPGLVLLIAANVRITRHDFTTLVRLVLAVGMLLGFIAAAQLFEATAGPTNRFLFNYYDNNPGQHFWLVLKQGRAASLMPQLSTLGMYIVLAFGLLAAQVTGGRSVTSPLVFAIFVAGVFLGGMMSGSKVFVGGVGILAFGLILVYRTYRRDAIRNMLAGVLAIVIVWSVSFVVFHEAAYRLIGLACPQPSQELVDGDPGVGLGADESEPSAIRAFYDRYLERYYIAYLESRFERNSGKVFRTGAIDIASNYPVTGLGFNVANRTTDSMALGIFIMGGTIGSVVYLAMLAAVATGLWRISRHGADPDLAATARVLLILTVAFLFISIGFHTFIQDRAGDAYWLLVGLLLGPLAMRSRSTTVLAGADGNGGSSPEEDLKGDGAPTGVRRRTVLPGDLASSPLRNGAN